MKRLLLWAAIMLFAVIVLIGMICIANYIAMLVNAKWLSVLTFFGVLGIESASFVLYMYALKYSD